MLFTSAIRSCRWRKFGSLYVRRMFDWAAGKQAFNPYQYTSGRWLKSDKEQRAARYRYFDFDKLCDKVISCSSGARSIISRTKVEGGFNRVFLLGLDNDQSLVLRIPFPAAGPPRLTTHSEVATIEYIRKRTSIPIPRVLDWSDDPKNVFGTEYIIQDHAQGVQLHGRWTSMNSPQHLEVITSLGRMAQQMSQLQFSAFGSIYFANAPIEDAELIPLDDEFCIGPHCGTRYWPCLPGDERSYEERPANRGPWRTHEDHVQGLVDTGASRIPKVVLPGALEYTDVDEYWKLNTLTHQTLRRLMATDAIERVARPMLLHDDIHKRNIFVSEQDPGHITALIDWQGTSIEPAFHYADEIPDLCDFAEPQYDPDRPAFDPDIGPSAATGHDQKKLEEDVELCRKAWAVIVRDWLPEVHAARSMRFLRLFRWASSGWQHGATHIRDDLLQLSKHWSTTLELPGSCPYQPSADEIARHEKLWEDFELVHRAKKDIMRCLLTDEEGWVPIDRWEGIKAVHDDLYHQWMAALVAEEEEHARRIWPFDVPS